MELEFRKLRRSEILQAAELAARSFDDYEYFTNWFPEKESRNRFQRSVISHEYRTNYGRADYLVAMDAATGQPCHDYQKTGDGIWYASSLTVDPAFQGTGVGTRFLEYWEDYVRERGGKQLVFFTNSKKNLDFYLKRGYEVFDERGIDYNGKTMCSWSLKKTM